MKNFVSPLIFATVALVASPGIVYAGGEGHHEMDHSKMDHSEMAHDAKDQAAGRGVINAIGADGKSVNITHEPMPDLGWPEMTMDIPVTNKVDLSKTKAGDAVDFTVKLGRDKKYRIIDMAPAKQ